MALTHAAPVCPTQCALCDECDRRWPAKQRSLLKALAAILLLVLPAHSQTLYQQSLQHALSRPGLEVLLYKPQADQVILNTFPYAPIPIGSLLKPFLAAAYARTHTAFPMHLCPGHAIPLALPQAIAESCNAYFLALAAAIDPTTLHDLPAPPDTSPKTLIGLTPTWLIAPTALVRAYATLLLSPDIRPEILEGMRLAAITGTASHIGRHLGGVLVKTGTAPCVQDCLASGDGLVLVAVPAAHPTLLLLVRKRGTTGAATAALAGPMLTQLKALHAY